LRVNQPEQLFDARRRKRHQLLHIVIATDHPVKRDRAGRFKLPGPLDKVAVLTNAGRASALCFGSSSTARMPGAMIVKALAETKTLAQPGKRLIPHSARRKIG
jgi:hypothetical protein